MLVPDLIQLLLCNPEDGDVPSLDYPRAKNCLQAALMWELERLDLIRVDAVYVTRGQGSGPLGVEFGPWLASLDRPEAQTHHWFRLRLEPEQGLLTEYFAGRLAAAGLAEKASASHLLFFKKTIYPLTTQGRSQAAELRTRLQAVVHALGAGPLNLPDFQPEEWMLGFFLDAMRVLPRAIGIKAQPKCLISAQALETFLNQGCLSPGLARSTYEFSRDAGDLNSLLNFGLDTLDLLTSSTDQAPLSSSSWGAGGHSLGEGEKLV